MTKAKQLKTALSTKFEHFAQQNSIEGMVYLSADNTLRTKAFWILVIVTGVVISLVLYRASYLDWEENPLVTTLDTVPVAGGVQFPTVTVCGEADAPADPWAVVEPILNTIKFECYSESLYLPDNCLEVEPSRKDFSFAVEGAFDTFVQSAGLACQCLRLTKFEAQTFNGTSLNSSNPPSKGLPATVTKLLTLVQTNATNPREMFRVIRSSIGKYTSLQSLLVEYPFNTSIKSNSSCVSIPSACYSELSDLLALLAATFWKDYTPVSDAFLPLGSSVALMSPPLAPSLSRQEISTVVTSLNCKQLSTTDMLLHSLMATLSKEAGLTGKNVSLFEVPAMLGLVSEATLLRPSLRDHFPYTRCRRYGANMSASDLAFERKDYEKCAAAWLRFTKEMFNGSSPSDLDSILAQTHPSEDESMPETCSGKYWSRFIIEDNLSATEDERLAKIMLIMRLSKHAAGAQFNIFNVVKRLFDKTIEAPNGKLAGYDINSRLTNKKIAYKDAFSTIPICWRNNAQDEDGYSCNLFSPVVTNMGMCYGYNALPMINHTLSARNASLFLSAFEKAFLMDVASDTPITEQASGGGEQLGLTFFLDRHVFRRFDRGGTRAASFGNFMVNINNVFNAVSMGSGSATVRPGFKTTLQVTPFEVSSAPEVRSLSLARRKCRFRDELDGTDMRLFAYYSQSACHFECVLKASRQVCRCTPWQYPFLDGDQDRNSTGNGTVQMCDVFGSLCFESLLRNSGRLQLERSDSCLPDCDDVIFSYVKEETPLDAAAFCQYGHPFYAYAIDKMITFNNAFTYNYNRVVNNISYAGSPVPSTDAKVDWCEQMVAEDIAVVSVQFASDKFLRSRQSIKMSLMDQIASLGGTLGLFTGMSLVTIVEVFFVLASTVAEIGGLLLGRRDRIGIKD